MSTVSTAPRVSGHDAFREARQLLDDALTSPADRPGWGADVAAALGGLHDILVRHQRASEAPGGTLEQMVDAKPGLQSKVRALRLEHPLLIDDARGLTNEVEAAVLGGTLDAERVRWKAGALQDAVRRHVARGTDLLYEAFHREEGGEG